MFPSWSFQGCFPTGTDVRPPAFTAWDVSLGRKERAPTARFKPAQGIALGTINRNDPQPCRGGLIPHIPFVIGHAVALQKRAVFLLK
jgi:hypothetical protein